MNKFSVDNLIEYRIQKSAEFERDNPECDWMRLGDAATIDYAIKNDVGKLIIDYCTKHGSSSANRLRACLYAAKRGFGPQAHRCLWWDGQYDLNRYYQHVREVAKAKRKPPTDKIFIEAAKIYRQGLPQARADLEPWFDAYEQLLAITKDPAERAKFDAVRAHVASGLSRPKPAAPPDPRPMADGVFWELIAAAKASATDIPDQCQDLADRLSRFKPKDVVKFSKLLHGFIAAAYRYDILAVGTIVGDGCSDDGFDYFLGWVILQGRAFYEGLLADPAKAAMAIKKGVQPEAEELLTVAGDVYSDLKGDELPASAYGKVKKLTGRKWDDAELPTLFPALYRKHS